MITWLRRMVWVAAFGLAAAAFAEDLAFSAKVDKTTVDVGDPITLTLTLSGDAGGIDLSTLKFPEEFAIAGQSQSTSFSIRSGATERSMSLVYVLIPQRAGTLKLGPFSIKRRDTELITEPIDITVNQGVLPPTKQEPQGGRRYTL
jgi:uncharacterized protein (DUF58 family)